VLDKIPHLNATIENHPNHPQLVGGLVQIWSPTSKNKNKKEVMMNFVVQLTGAPKITGCRI